MIAVGRKAAQWVPDYWRSDFSKRYGLVTMAVQGGS